MRGTREGERRRLQQRHLVFSFLRPLVFCRMPLANKKPPWELVCHLMHYSSVNETQVFLYNMCGMKTAEELFESCSQEVI